VQLDEHGALARAAVGEDGVVLLLAARRQRAPEPLRLGPRQAVAGDR
jgi:hypothetical protein